MKLKKSTAIRALSVVLLALFSTFTFAQSYGSFRDTGNGNLSNQPWGNEAAQMAGALGFNPDVIASSYTTTAQATANVSTDQNLVAIPLLANQLLKANRTLQVKGGGIYSLGAASTVTIKVKLCTVSGCGSGTVITACQFATGSNANTAVVSSFNYECNIGTSTAAGANSKVIGKGVLNIEVGASNTAALSQFGDVTTAESSTIDLTGSVFVQTSVTFGTANASNTATQMQTFAWHTFGPSF